ncbi:MAG TPA: hypothetical protein DCM59_10425 [Clostridium sp.]|nr:hypothetical protein [Clostridium sp.]
MKNESKVLENKKELTVARQKRLKEFNRIREELLEQGYKEKILSVSYLKANIMALVTSVPVIGILCVLYFVINRGDYTYDGVNIVFWLFVFAGFALHELIHGITWAAFCEKKWEAIGFGIEWSMITPYCCCNEGLKLNEYALGCAMPTIIVGFLPYIIGLILGNYLFALFGVFHILGGGGDAYILWLIRREKNAIIVDYPYLVGCVAFEK